MQLHDTKAPGNRTSNPKPKRIGHTLVNETAIRFWRNFPRHADMLERSNYQTAGCIPLHHPPWTSEMNNIPQMQRFEVVHESDFAARGIRLTLQP